MAYHVNIFLGQSIQGPTVQKGAYGYFMECLDLKGNIIKTREKYFVTRGTRYRLELLAAIAALQELKPVDVSIYMDVEHVATCVQKGWVQEWSRNGWMTKNRTPVKNLELWQQLEELLGQMLSVEVFYVMEHEHSLRMFNEMGWRLDEYV